MHSSRGLKSTTGGCRGGSLAWIAPGGCYIKRQVSDPIEQRLDMIDRRRPRPWTHIFIHEIITEGLLIIGERCVLLVGYRGERLPTPLCLLTAARSSDRAGYEVVPDTTGSG